jgi:two-component system, cell cycle sensor histidine kinase and response regulator CckA
MAHDGPEHPPQPATEIASLLFDRVDNMVCTLDLSGRFTSVNTAGEQLTGYTADELVGTFASELIAPDFRDAAVEQFRARLAGTQDEHSDETVLLTRTGVRVPIAVTSTVVLSGDAPAGVLGVVHDLTEQRRVAAALLESERRFRRSFESAAIGMALVAPEGRFLEVNASLCGIVGYTADELLSLTYQDITHADDVDLDVEYARQVLAGEIRSYSMEKRYIHKSGAIVWIQLSVSLVTDADGAPVHFVAQIQDITERKHAQEELELSEARLAEAQQTAHIGSWEWIADTGAVTMSSELRRIYAVDADEDIALDRLILERVHPLDRERLIAASNRVLTLSDHSELEFRALLPSGEVKWLYSRSEPLIESGRVTGRRGIAQDITERKAAEERLAAAERQYRTLVEHLPLGMYIRPLDMTKPNIYASPQVEPMLGYPASEWESDPDLLARIVHPDDRERVLGEARRVRATGEPVRDEYRYVTKDGRTVWVQDETYVVTDEDDAPAYVQGYLLDITERKQAEAERDRLREELHHAQKLEALGRLAGGIAHDFNNMLTAIRGYSELLVDALEPGSPAHREALQVRRAAERAAELPQQLLAFGRKQTLQPRLVDLNEIVITSSHLLKRLITESVELVTRPSSDFAHAFVDPSQIEHVLVNLALNARDAMPAGGTLTIETRVVELTEPTAEELDLDAAPGPYVVISVGDTGLGMEPEVRDRIFEPYFTTKEPGLGAGLGLSSVYGTVTQSGGFVRVESEPGSGTTLDVYLPRVSAANALVSGEDRGKPAVLLVEDEEIVRAMAKRVLEGAGFHVLAAADGDEALQLYEQVGGLLVAVVADLVLPGLTGRELAERIRELDPAVPIAFMSGYTDDPFDTALAHGENAVLVQKPFTPRVLVETVRALAASEPAGLERAAISCVIADDHPAVLDSVSRYLETKDVDVTLAVDGTAALRRIEEVQPAVALLDVGMGEPDGIDVTRRAGDVSPETRVIVYTGRRDPDLLDRSFDAGARGFVFKESPLSELERAVKIVAAGGTYIDPDVARLRESEPAASPSPLTNREVEILTLIAGGMTNERVASELSISPETVQSHVRHAMDKLDASTRTEAVAKALRLALIA